MGRGGRVQGVQGANVSKVIKVSTHSNAHIIPLTAYSLAHSSEAPT